MQVFGVGSASPLGMMRIGRYEPAAASGPRQDPKDALRGLLRELRGLRREMSTLERVLGKGPTGNRGAMALSADIGIETDPTAAQLESTEEINGLITTFTTGTPQFSGHSTSTPTIGGTYNGAQPDTLTFVAMNGATSVGQQAVTFDVYNGQNQVIEQVTIGANAPPGTTFTLSNGLTLSLSAGSVKTGDSFQLGVHPPTAMAVNATNPFNGTGSQSPNFELGYAVTAGQFQVNGQTVLVQANDSIQDVINTINSAGAGVTATLEADERIRLTHDTPGAAGQITLTGDTSGFLAATKLANAVLDPGTDDETSVAMSGVGALSGISSGAFSINGTAIAIDPAVDSLQDIVDRINLAEVGVTASLGPDGRMSIHGGATFSLSDNGTGLFSVLDIAEGTHKGPQDEAGLRRLLASPKVQAALRAFEGALNGLFTKPSPRSIAGTNSRVRSYISRAVNDAAGSVFGDQSQGLRALKSAFGLEFSTDDPKDGILDLNRAGLREGIAKDAAQLHDFFTRDASGTKSGGLLSALDDGISNAEGLIIEALDRRGTVFDLFA